MKVLIIDSDRASVANISLYLRRNWSKTTIVSAANGIKGIEMFSKELFDIVILEIDLPGENGFEVISSIRSFSTVPLIALTSKGIEGQTVRGLNLGADDCINKPVCLEELSARAKAVLRRCHNPEVENFRCS